MKKIICSKGLNSKNKNIKAGGSPQIIPFD